MLKDCQFWKQEMIVKNKMSSSYLIEKTIVGDEFRFLLGKLTDDDQKRKINGKEFRKKQRYSNLK